MEQMDKESMCFFEIPCHGHSKGNVCKGLEKTLGRGGESRNLGFRALPQLLWLLGQVTCLLLDLPFIICEVQLLPPHLSRRAAVCTTEVRSRVTGPNSLSGP